MYKMVKMCIYICKYANVCISEYQTTVDNRHFKDDCEFTVIFALDIYSDVLMFIV